MKHSVSVIVLAGLSVAATAFVPASAAAKRHRPPAQYTSMNAERTTPTVPVQPITAGQDFGGDGTDIAIRLQDGHHGEGQL
ncbi:hypothetical protein ACLBWX_04300 [Methylobacterium sp. M6A4_1b]